MTLAPWPHFDEQQISCVADTLRSGRVNSLSHGDKTRLFEKRFAAAVGCKYAIATANGTLALTLAYKSLNIGPGDEVITTPRSFVATASAIALLGAKPVFADVDIDSGCITAETIAPLINPRTKAIAVVHLGGWPADMNSIVELAKAHSLSVIEDCAQAHGAQILVNSRWQSVGSFGDVATWSFCTDKIMSTGGEGGMVTTSNPDIYDFIWSYKDHGKTLQTVSSPVNRSGFNWLHERLGTNYRLTEMQSALGLSQLERLPEWSRIRNDNADVVRSLFSDLSVVRTPAPHPNKYKHAWYKLHCYLKLENLSKEWTRDRILNEISKSGYPALTGSCGEVYLEKCFDYMRDDSLQILPSAQLLGGTSIAILVHPTIDNSQMVTYAEVIREILLKASLT